MTADDYIKIHLATMAHAAAHKHGVTGVVGAMFVIRNRVLAGLNHGDWMANILEFQPVLADYPDPREPNFQRVLQWADVVYDGTTVDNWTNGALSFGIDGPFPYPDAEQPAPDRVAKIGQLNFYK